LYKRKRGIYHEKGRNCEGDKKTCEKDKGKHISGNVGGIYIEREVNIVKAGVFEGVYHFSGTGK
jgi:hypothetical protein